MRKTSLPPLPPPKKTLFPKFLLFLFFSSLIERRKRDSCVPTITLVVIQQTTISMKNKKTTLSTKPSRKTRTKTRKHKFISLRQELSQSNSPDSGQKMTHNHNHQLNLFPLHPENLFEEKDDNVSYFFDADDDGVTLNGVVFSDQDTLSPSLTYACGGQDSEEVGPPPSCLEKSALRHKERNDSEEEKWVCYSEVVEKKEEEVTSCISDYWSKNNSQRLSLKLDYQEIMNAWSDKGPLYIDVECPQIVPDVLDDTLRQDSSNVLVDVGNMGIVPQMMVLEDSNSTINGVDEEARKIGQREARVLRYKEKRRSRLFSKTIRYQVRKLNAEKRPRMKGRFVKRS